MYSNMHRFMWNAAMNAELEIVHGSPKTSVIVLELYLFPSLFEIAVRQLRMASYISRNVSSVVCRSTRLVSHGRLTFSTPTFFKPSRFLQMLISSVDCYSRRRLFGEYLKNIARVCMVDIMSCTSGTFLVAQFS